MHATNGAPREVALPVSVFTTLRRELAREVGPLPAIHALHAAGYAAGSAAASTLRGDDEGELASMSGDVFWARLRTHLARRGWGRLDHRPTHEAVGLLVSSDWVEARAEQEEDASCSFTTGYLSGLLTELAGGPMAVLEVSCRARGDDACTFAFGSETAVHEIYGDLLEGTDLRSALAAL